MTLFTLLALGFGGSAGALLRYALSQKFDRKKFPLGTMLSNIFATACLAFIYLIVQRLGLEKFQENSMFFTLVFLEIMTGALSTYASFAYQCVNMLRQGDIKSFFKYLSYTFGFSYAAFYAIFFAGSLI